MSSLARRAEKKKEWEAQCEKDAIERQENYEKFREISDKLDQLGIDPNLLVEYLDYVRNQ